MTKRARILIVITALTVTVFGGGFLAPHLNQGRMMDTSIFARWLVGSLVTLAFMIFMFALVKLSKEFINGDL